MAVVVPAVVGFFAAGGAAGIAAAAGSVLAGTAGLGAFATLATAAGGFMATIGGLTKNQKLAKFGGYLSLAGGIGQVANSIMSGAASSVAGEAAKGAASGGVESAVGDIAKDGAASLFDGAPQLGGDLGANYIDQVANGTASNTLASPKSMLGPPGEMLTTAGGNAGSALSLDSINQPNLVEAAKSVRMSNLQPGFDMAGMQDPALSKLAGVASEIKSPSHLQSLLDSTGSGVGKVGQFLKDNKELVSMVGSGIESITDPRREMFDAQMSLMEQRRRRLNQPIQLGAIKPIGG